MVTHNTIETKRKQKREKKKERKRMKKEDRIWKSARAGV